MTRENKLALVVGFTLILVVGILVSDHFSLARAQASPLLGDFGADDPLLAQHSSDPDLLRADDPRAVDRARAGDSVAEIPMGTAAHRDVVTPAARTLPPPAPTAIDSPTTAQAQPRDTEHVVRRNESLTHICRAFYGSEAYVPALARYNELANPDLVVEGQTIRLPDAAALIGGAPRPAGASSRTPEKPVAPRTYTVADGDNLSKIAGQLLGSRNRYLDLYQANRDQLESPDDIRPGMVLRIPS